METIFDHKYRNEIYEIKGTFYAIPESFTNFDGVDPILPDDSGLEYIPPEFVKLDWDEAISYRILALRQHENEWQKPCIHYSHNCLHLNGRAFGVLTETEADIKVDRMIWSKAREVVPEPYLDFLDEVKLVEFLTDAGRGPVIATYDGIEHRCETADGILYIYRLN